jgi:hypothetical protein
MTYLKAQWDRVGAWALILIGFGALLAGWLGISGTTILAAQMPYIVSGGMLGLALIGVGGMLWLSADLKDEWRKLDAIHDELATPQRHDTVVTPEFRPATAAERELVDLTTADASRQAARR